MINFSIDEGTQNAIALLNYMQSTILELRDRNAKLLEKNEQLSGSRVEYVKDSFFRLRDEVRRLQSKLAEEAKYQEENRKANEMLNQEAAKHLKEIEDLREAIARREDALAVSEQRYVDEKNKNDHLEKMYAYQNEEINILKHNIMRLSSNQLTAAQKEKCDRVISEIERLRDNG